MFNIFVWYKNVHSFMLLLMDKMIHDMIILLAETIIIDLIECSMDQSHYKDQ